MRIGIPEKLSFTLFLTVAALVFPWMASAGLVVVLLILRALIPDLRPLDAESASRFRKFFAILVLLVLFMTLLNALLMRSGEPVFDLGFSQLYSDGLQFGLVTGSRLLLIASAFLVLFGSTRIADLAEYLNGIGLPTPIVMTTMLALHFLDHLPGRIQQIFLAQESRGAPLRGSFIARLRSFLLLLRPLVLSSIVESIERGTALELRGYHSGISLRPQSKQSHARPWSVITVLFLVLSLLAFVYRLVSWLIVSR
jgi:energy-coupling factor transport system permease protein